MKDVLFAALHEAPGMSPGLPLGLPAPARTVQVRIRPAKRYW